MCASESRLSIPPCVYHVLGQRTDKLGALACIRSQLMFNLIIILGSTQTSIPICSGIYVAAGSQAELGLRERSGNVWNMHQVLARCVLDIKLVPSFTVGILAGLDS